jgi:hypothetical protein
VLEVPRELARVGIERDSRVRVQRSSKVPVLRFG